MKTDAAAITEQDMHLLPRNMRALVSVVGIVALLQLVRAHGGAAEVQVPKEATADSPLWELIGPEALHALVRRYGGEHIEIAKCELAAREIQRRQIRYEYFELGHTQDALARRHAFTVRHIRNILYYIAEPKNGGGQNLSLF